jgi:hypothetical protein
VADEKKEMDPRERAIRKRLKEDFAHYASRCLRIRPKEIVQGELPKFQLNEAQLYLHQKLEEQLRRTGRIRALVLKGRQMGCSTYTEGRFYWRVSHQRGALAYILTHEDPATRNLFKMAKTYHENCPALVRPSTGASNANELLFDVLESGYKVGTAGSKGTGRSSTLQFFHGSEVAYWPNAATHMAGVLQAVPDLPGTEVILESTSNGPEGLFYEMCMAAQRGEGDYILVFIPWFWMKEYTKPVPEEGFTPTSEETKYQAAHGLTDGQMLWRRSKIVELGGLDSFRREYPATAEEAFKASAEGALWSQELINATRVPHLPRDAEGNPLPLRRVVVGVDPPGGATECGIITGGVSRDGHLYIFRDDSAKVSPEQWAARARTAYGQEQADRIVGEKNFGGDMVESTIRLGMHPSDRLISYKNVTASRGKELRAEPIKALWEQGRAHIVGNLHALEDEMTTWEPGVSKWSPNRLDAMVWVGTELMLGNSSTVKTTEM